MEIMAQEVATISEVVVSSLGPDILLAVADYMGLLVGVLVGGLAGMGLVKSWGW
jgi:hypothetical protein